MNKFTTYIKDFHGSRATGVGSSDIPVLAGLYRNFGSTSLSLWEQKTGRAQPWEGNARTAWGHKLEGMVLREFIESRYGEDMADKYLAAKKRGNSSGIFKTETEARMPGKPYVLAHADLLVKPGAQHGNQPYIVEAKTTGLMSGKRREGRVFAGYDPEDRTGQGIPDAVYLQVQWQMLAYGVNTAYVAVLIDTADYREYGPIYADTRVQERILALAERFWRLVETDTPPAPETWQDVTKLYPDYKDTTAMVSGEEEQKAREMIAEDKTIATKIKDLEERRGDIKNALGILIGENAVLSSAEGQILAKASEQTRESISLATIKKNDPAMLETLREKGFINSTSFRTLRY